MLFQKIGNKKGVCPRCYTDSIYQNDEGYTLPAPDRDTEPEFKKTGERYKCPECGLEYVETE